jgi:hypothetical protein
MREVAKVFSQDEHTMNITCSNGWWGIYTLTADEMQKVMDYANSIGGSNE